MRWMWMALVLLISPGAPAGEVYRWVDERGVVHFSDQPHPDAERVRIKPVQSYTAPPVAPAPPQQSGDRPVLLEPPGSYTQLSIVSPRDGETLWNIGAQLNVEIAMHPALGVGHILAVYLDGQRVPDVPQATQFTLVNVFRGERRLRVAILDANGRELVTSGPVVFYVQQASLQNPNRPQRPAPGPGGG
jgi:hypothetical protein